MDKNSCQKPNDLLRRLQETEMEILDVVAGLCEREGITWFLDSGTALGAIRHKGFIPWDDDVDIGFLRNDYELFLIAASSSLPEGYSLHTLENTQNHACLWAKVYKDGTKFITRETQNSGIDMGIFIDIVPYDVLAPVGENRKKQLSHALRNTRLLYLYASKYITVPHTGLIGSLERAACFIAHYFVRLFYSQERILQAFNKTIEMGVVEKQEQEQYICLGYPYTAPLEKEDLVPTTMTEFEGKAFPVPGNVEAYLTKLYGEWRKLPPEKDRRTHLPIKLVFSPEEDS